MKLSSTFKLSKSAKRVLATKTGEAYNQSKRMFIDSELAEIRAKFAKGKKEKNEG